MYVPQLNEVGDAADAQDETVSILVGLCVGQGAPFLICLVGIIVVYSIRCRNYRRRRLFDRRKYLFENNALNVDANELESHMVAANSTEHLVTAESDSNYLSNTNRRYAELEADNSISIAENSEVVNY